MTDEALRHHILVAFEYCYLHDGWVNPLAEALEGVTAEEALWRPGPEGKGIWDIVNHLAAWNENIVERVKTDEKSARPKEGAWPSPPGSPDEEAWEQAKVRLNKSLTSMQELIETEPMDNLVNRAYGIEDLFCRFNHIAYHLGQITKMREMGLR
jgi:uncharacterized damage-inducible protein DinB